MSHSPWKTLRERKLAEGLNELEDVAEARREIRLSMALAKAVYDRRTELGLTQSELAVRSGLTQAKISRIEGSDTVPTLPLLSKLAKALDVTLHIALGNDQTQVTFAAHHIDAAARNCGPSTRRLLPLRRQGPGQSLTPLLSTPPSSAPEGGGFPLPNHP
jgi:transcriptional regulator with XRE-family HTH domain